MTSSQDGGTSVYDVSWGRDLALVLGAGAVAGGLELATPLLVSRRCACDTGELRGVDRIALHHSSAAMAQASDVLVGLFILAPFALDALDLSRGGAWTGPLAEDAAVMAQALGVSLVAAQVAKLSVQRPRPVLYRAGPDDPAWDADESYVSFYSGHTSIVFAAGASFATTFALRRPTNPWRFVVFAGAGVAGAAMGGLRIYAGKHFPSDVLAGALVGSAIGVAVPLLHRGRTLELAGWPTPGGLALGVSGPL